MLPVLKFLFCVTSRNLYSSPDQLSSEWKSRVQWRWPSQHIPPLFAPVPSAPIRGEIRHFCFHCPARLRQCNLPLPRPDRLETLCRTGSIIILVWSHRRKARDEANPLAPPVHSPYHRTIGDPIGDVLGIFPNNSLMMKVKCAIF